MLGFTLAELAVVLLVIGLLMFALLPTSAVMLSNSRHSATQQKLNNIDAALVNFVIVNKRLPCPADGSIAMTASGAGSEGGRTSGDCTNNQANGVVPWVALGLNAGDIVDAWNNQITYRVAFGLTRDPVASQNAALDMSSCDPAGTAAASGGSVGSINVGTCATTCTGTFAAANCTSPSNFLATKGLDVKSGTPGSTPAAATTIMSYAAGTGAAYVLISHGDNGYGARSAFGVYQTPTSDWTTATGTTFEDPNWNTGHTVTSAAPPAFMDMIFSDSSSVTAHFDDIVVRPSLFSVISRAQLGPRSH